MFCTSERVHIIPILDNLALLASSKTSCTPSSVTARKMLHTTKISWQRSIYRSVITRRAEFRSRSPSYCISSRAMQYYYVPTRQVDQDQASTENMGVEENPERRSVSGPFSVQLQSEL
jgi:hypothetical protein